MGEKTTDRPPQPQASKEADLFLGMSRLSSPALPPSSGEPNPEAPAIEILTVIPAEVSSPQAPLVVKAEGGPLSGPPQPEENLNPEQLQYQGRVMRHVNRESYIFSLCYETVREFVVHALATQVGDSAELAESMFGGGKRTPLEIAEPQIAIELYKEVRHSMRDEEERFDRQEKKGDGSPGRSGP